LLRVLLAGNPLLFAPPELYLLNYVTMAQRQEALSNKLNEHLLTGTIVLSCTFVPVAKMRPKKSSVPRRPGDANTDFYALLQELIGGTPLGGQDPALSVAS
jgi:hypothetical protein